MGIFGNSSPFDQDVERATSETLTGEDWTLMMEICDRAAGGGAAAARDVTRAVLRRLAHADPHVALLAATLLDALVANCGRALLLEVASRDVAAELRRLAARPPAAVAARLRQLLRKWAEGEFRDDPQLDLIPALHRQLAQEAPGRGSSPALGSSGGGTGGTSGSGGAGGAAAAAREEEELARAIALSLRESGSGALYPRVESARDPAPRDPAPRDSVPRDTAPSDPAPRDPPPARTVRALYDFEAAEDNELTFHAGDILTVLDSSDPNWWRGRGALGEGLFPANFVSADLTPEPASVKGGARVQFAEAEREDDEELVIDEAAMDLALSALHEADPSAPPSARDPAPRLEARVLRQGALVDAALERADRRHARLTALSAALVDALNLYHELMRAPAPPAPPAPPAHPAHPAPRMY